MDQKQANTANKGIGCVFIGFGIVMLGIGISMLVSIRHESIENTLTALFIISGALMLYGGYNQVNTARKKDKAISLYQNDINIQIEQLQQPEVQTGLTNDLSKNHLSTEETSNLPKLLALWKYEAEDWKLMKSNETKRRIKEGIWVSFLVGFLGIFALSQRGADYLTGFIFAGLVGVLIAVLKVWISARWLKSKKQNSIAISTNALVFNGEYRTINDDHVKLEYIKTIPENNRLYLEFSIQWPTRNGLTNDQIRVLVPNYAEQEVPKILDYYSKLGVKTS